MPDRNIVQKIGDAYYFQILKAYNNNYESVGAIGDIATALKEVFRYFEPAFFEGRFFMCKHFGDEFIFNKANGQLLYDKNILINRTSGEIIIQTFANGDFYIWDGEHVTDLYANSEILLYRFENHKDVFVAHGTEVDITVNPKGSRFAPQYFDLIKALTAYSIERVYNSSCPIFSNSWYDSNRIFFKSEGSGNNAPEKYMQQSLYEFLRTQESLRGIGFECVREFNVKPQQPKPVDIRMQWKEANRVALIEMKWIGSATSTKTDKTRTINPSEINAGYDQLKGYFDEAERDMPSTIVKAHMVVIDGRRNNIKKGAITVSYQDGMYYKDEEIELEHQKKYYLTNPRFEKPVRMFSSPITV
tara:strand:+ start:3702 stop:4778 length:1077 start_codon:yes stop_codon:yes gene_type:complete